MCVSVSDEDTGTCTLLLLLLLLLLLITASRIIRGSAKLLTDFVFFLKLLELAGLHLKSLVQLRHAICDIVSVSVVVRAHEREKDTYICLFCIEPMRRMSIDRSIDQARDPY